MTRVVCGGWVYFTMGVCILLSGCSLTPLQKDFSCSYKDGEPCLSITEADKKAVLGTRDSSFEKEETNFFTSHESRTTSHALQAPQRIPDRVARVWMAPFEDTDGNWHAASYVYTVSDSAHWKPRGVKIPEALSKPVKKDPPLSSRTPNPEPRTPGVS